MSKRLLHTPEGVRDIYGIEYENKLWSEQALLKTIHSYGYQEIQTPTFEFFDAFSREVGTTPSRELYKFFDKEGNTLALRPDFTPSIARCASKYFMEEATPIRLCYSGNAFHNISELQGKWNEVTQIGADLINDNSVEADAEIIGLVVEALRNSKLSRFLISIGHVEYFKGLCEIAGLDEETEDLLRDFVSGKNYFAAEELLQSRDIKEPHRGNLLKVADLLRDMTSLSEAESLADNERSYAAIKRLKDLYEVLKYYHAQDYVSFDLGMLSKYHYYTGMIFKAYTYGVGNPIVKGGRYNNLLRQFGKDAPAVGFVVVVDDLLLALSGQNVPLPTFAPTTSLYYGEGEYQVKLSEAFALRQEGHKVAMIRRDESRS
ncbi:MAG: ATP phosphoribosyltransferase regulatory subunit [Lachnospiraceae bacterium]|jgi:ATP phosphoribosyltransferase regulatory subunit|nr:ATP phosphoribosyltransferase regulatory subunit [Lachnospiraceae bacterium]